MPLDSISRVTEAVMDLIAPRATAKFGMAVMTSPLSPQNAPSGSPFVNVYLFHVIESAHYKNQPPRRGSGDVPIQFVPLGLDLHYVVTTHIPDDSSSDMAALDQQRLLGIVAKIIHDNPVVTDGLLSSPILGEGNGFRLVHRPVPLDEAIGFWSSDEDRLTRLSLFIEASVVLVEPEVSTQVTGTVLSLGAFVQAAPAPQLLCSRSQLTFSPPGFAAQTANAEPARVALFDGVNDPWGAPAPTPLVQERLQLNNRLIVDGSALGSPGQRVLELRAVGTEDRTRLKLDPPDSANSDWEIAIASGSITLRFFTTATDVEGNSVEFIPGLHTIRLSIEDGPFPRASNELAFALIAQIQSVTHNSGNEYTITVLGAYLQAAGIEIALSVGSEILQPDDPVVPGTFLVTGPNTIVFERDPPVGESSDDFPMPVNLTINGVAATPAWLEASP